MAALSFSKSHSVGADEASAKIRTLLDTFAGDYPKLKITTSWTSDRGGKCSGRGFDASFAISDTDVRIDISLGLIARRFKDRIDGRMRRELADAFPT